MSCKMDGELNVHQFIQAILDNIELYVKEDDYKPR